MSSDNRRTALDEVVSLEAWHKGFTRVRKTTDLHIDVAFSEGRIGSDSGSNVRFRLFLKRADVVVVVPPNEPAKIDINSVSRDTNQVRVKSEKSSTSKKEIGGEGKTSLGVNLTSPKSRIEAAVSGSIKALKAETVKILEDSSAMKIVQIRTFDGSYAWKIESATEQYLKGKPWDAVKRPRMKIADTRPNRDKGIEPSIRVEIRCRREDLEIQDIIFKKNKLWKMLCDYTFGENKLIAAEAVIRTRLFESGLVSGDLRDPFTEVTICAIISEAV